jgi:outer membrane protein OmpA-like peptidoglycan-associated protein
VLDGIRMPCTVDGKRRYVLGMGGRGKHAALDLSFERHDFGKCFLPVDFDDEEDSSSAAGTSATAGNSLSRTTYATELSITNNEADADMTLELDFTPQPHLSVGFTSPTVLRPGQTIKIPLEFTPQEERQYEDELRFTVNGLHSEIVRVAGVGSFNWAKLDDVLTAKCHKLYPLVRIDLVNGYLIALKTVEFKPNSATPKEEATFNEILRQVGAVLVMANDYLPDERDLHLVIGGHADFPKSKAMSKYAIELTQRRADRVKEHLAGLPGVERQHLNAKGYGATRPLPGVVVGEGDRPNMRVTFEAANVRTVGGILSQPLKYEGLE